VKKSIAIIATNKVYYDLVVAFVFIDFFYEVDLHARLFLFAKRT